MLFAGIPNQGVERTRNDRGSNPRRSIFVDAIARAVSRANRESASTNADGFEPCQSRAANEVSEHV